MKSLNPKPQTIKGLKQTHAVFVEDSIRSESKYLVTKREEWLNLGDDLYDSYHLIICQPRVYSGPALMIRKSWCPILLDAISHLKLRFRMAF